MYRVFLCRDLSSQLVMRLPSWALAEGTDGGLFMVLVSVVSADVLVRFVTTVAKVAVLLFLPAKAGYESGS